MLLYDPSRLAALLDERKADGLLAVRPSNVRYLTKFPKEGGSLGLVLRDEVTEPVLIVPSASLDFVLEDIGETTEIQAYGEFFRHRNADQDLNVREELIARLHEGTQRGYDRDQCAAAVLEQRGMGSATLLTDVRGDELADLSGLLPALDIRADESAFGRLRMIKGEEEIRRLSDVAGLTEEAIGATLENVTEGVSQAQLAAAFHLAVAARGAKLRLDNVSLGRSAAFGNANIPEDQLSAGDVIRFDVGAIKAGYVSDMSRCYSLGDPGEKVRQYHQALHAGQKAALEALRPGASAQEVFEIAVETVRSAGLPHYERTHVGHGIGLHGDGYDRPLLAPQDTTELEAGMVLCVETPYYEIGFGGLQVEDMVVVTEGEPRALTTSRGDLQTIS